ncbi:MAG TPA: hypothetical protein VI758_04180 [Bacteroidota bacterium]
MSAKRYFVLFGKIVVLTALLIACFAIASQLSGVSAPPAERSAAPADTGALMKAMLVSSFLEVIALSAVILRSRWVRWKLTGAVFLGFYGSMTVVAQIESLVYLRAQLPAGMVPRLFLMGAVVSALFTPIAVIILGKMKRGQTAESRISATTLTQYEWLWKLAALAAAYVALYYLFGYYVAWKNPAVQKYYGGTDPGSFPAQLGTILNSTPWMFPLQAARALLWVVLLLPMVRMLKGTSAQVAVVTACFLSVWSAQLLLPNPYMPPEVAHAHLVETALSNWLFGFIAGWLLCRHHASFRDIFRPGREQLAAGL